MALVLRSRNQVSSRPLGYASIIPLSPPGGGSTRRQVRMTHTRKIEAYKALMAEKGIGEATAAPPLWNWLWSMGMELPPPLYMGFLPLALLGGTFFGIVFGAFAWAMGSRGARSMSFDEAGLVALASGAAFGLAVAWFTRRLARKHGLGSWSAFDAGRQRA